MRIYSFGGCSGVVRQQMVKLGLDFRDWGLHSWDFGQLRGLRLPQGPKRPKTLKLKQACANRSFIGLSPKEEARGR